MPCANTLQTRIGNPVPAGGGVALRQGLEEAPSKTTDTGCRDSGGKPDRDRPRCKPGGSGGTPDGFFPAHTIYLPYRQTRIKYAATGYVMSIKLKPPQSPGSALSPHSLKRGGAVDSHPTCPSKRPPGGAPQRAGWQRLTGGCPIGRTDRRTVTVVRGRCHPDTQDGRPGRRASMTQFAHPTLKHYGRLKLLVILNNTHV